MAAQKIIDELLSAGWIEKGGISNPGIVARSGAGKFVGANYSFRLRFRFKDTNKRVTVGKRTTCFYEVIDKQAYNFENLKTVSEEDLILTKIKEFTDAENRH